MGAHPGFVFVLLALWAVAAALIATAIVGLVQTVRAVRGPIGWDAVRRAVAWFVIPWLLAILGGFLCGGLFPLGPVRRALAVSMLLAGASAAAVMWRMVQGPAEGSARE